MLRSVVLPRVIVEPKNVAHLSFNSVRFGSKCCMENMWEKEMENFKSSSQKRNRGNVKVSVRDQVLSPLINVDSREVSLNGIQEEILAKEMEFSGGIGIVSFITGKVFLITGATGFLAKVLIEKILRSVPDVGKIYLLMKAKDEEAAMQRIKTEIINTELFKTLQQTHGKSHEQFLLSKLVPVIGNLCESNLGMEMEIAEQLANEVDIIINSGGNTTFDESFDVSLTTNTLGPCRFLSFAKRCKKLMLFLHVSTAYVNGGRQGTVMEKPFHLGDSIAREKAASESPLRSSFPLLNVEAEVKIALDARKRFQDNTVSTTMKDLGLERARSYGWHDTYVFTKAMGEMMIGKQREDIPIVIVRPSVIESTFREPLPGWIEGIRMLDPLLVCYAKGLLTGFPVDGKATIDIVPADMVVNAILAATAKHATVRTPGLSIYHIGSSVMNPILLQDFFGYFFDYFKSFPYMDLQKRPINIERMKLFNSMDEFHSHIQTEAVRKTGDATHQGKNFLRRFRKSMEIAKHLAKIYEPYMFYGARFDNSNTEKLWEEMSEEEQRSFGFDLTSIDWKDYICNIHIPGVMTHSLKGRGM